MSSIDIAGTIGTWVAVFLALFALLGVVGPILVWRTSRTLRNQALANLDAGLAENGGFVSRGVSFTRTIKLFRKVKAPVLKRAPQVKDRVLAWDSTFTLPWYESASWVQFGAALRAYGIGFPVGDELLYTEEAYTQLPVTSVWILTLGLQGRFGIRKDLGKLPRKAVKGVVSKQPRPGHAIHRDTTAHQHAHLIREMLARPGHWADDYNYDGDYNSRLGGTSRLSGLVGCLTLYRTPGASSIVTFEAHEQERIGALSKEALDVGTLFWLSVGCLPVGDGRVLSLEDVLSIAPGDQSYPAPEPETTSRRRSRYPSMGTNVRFAENHNDYDSVSDDGGERRRRQSLYVNVSDGSRRRTTNDPQKPRKFCLAATEERVEALLEYAVTLGAEKESVETFTLEEVAISDEDLALLDEDAGRTYVPCDRTWVRLGPARNSDRAPMPWFLERPDAQLLARALIELPICPQGFLIYHPARSACRTLLIEASAALPRTLNYLLLDLKLFTLEPKTEETLHSVLSRLYAHIDRFSYTRSFAAALFNLDEALGQAVKCAKWTQLFIQAIVLTSPEFRDLVNQSLRNVKECLSTTVTIEVKATTATLNVVAAFGLVQRFPIDADVLLERDHLTSIAGTHEMPYPTVLLLFLKAILRSTFLHTSLDSMPLWEMVMGSEELVIDGASPSIYSR